MNRNRVCGCGWGVGHSFIFVIFARLCFVYGCGDEGMEYGAYIGMNRTGGI